MKASKNHLGGKSWLLTAEDNSEEKDKIMTRCRDFMFYRGIKSYVFYSVVTKSLIYPKIGISGWT